MSRPRVWVNLTLAAILGIATGWWIWQRPQREAGAQSASSSSSAAAASLATVPYTPDEQNTIQIYKAVSPAVVNITSTTIQYDFFFNVFPSQGSGSGFLIDDKGDILTNYHVISGARKVEVTLPDGSRHRADLVGRDRASDLAVIKITDRKGLPSVSLGNSENLQVGQKVLAIGNPFGEFQGTLTTGVISSLRRSIRDDEGRVLEDLIQTDAAINPGNSGGPLLNSRGEVIGINSAIFGPGTNVGIGFAIPINDAKAILADLLKEGRVRRAFLGAQTEEFAPSIAGLLNLPASQGLLVARLTRGGPADEAGIQPGRSLVLIGNQEFVIGGDLLVEVDGTPLANSRDLTRYIEKKKPGDIVRFTLFRGTKRMMVDVKLGERPDSD